MHSASRRVRRAPWQCRAMLPFLTSDGVIRTLSDKRSWEARCDTAPARNCQEQTRPAAANLLTDLNIVVKLVKRARLGGPNDYRKAPQRGRFFHEANPHNLAGSPRLEGIDSGVMPSRHGPCYPGKDVVNGIIHLVRSLPNEEVSDYA